MESKKVTIDNLDIYYRFGGVASKPTLLWLDGLSISKDLNGRLGKTGKFLSNFFNDFHVYSLEYPSFMRSDIPATEWDMDKYVDLVHKFIHTEKLKTPILLMGHSFGAMIAYAYTAKYSEDIKLLVVSAPPVTYKYSPNHLKLFEYFKRIMISFLNSKIISDKVKKFVPKYFMSTSNENLNKYSVEQFKVAITTLIHMAMTDYTDLASRIKNRVVLVTGNKDFLVPIENSINIKKEIKNCIHYDFNEGHTTLPWRIADLKPEIIKLMNE